MGPERSGLGYAPEEGQEVCTEGQGVFHLRQMRRPFEECQAARLDLLLDPKSPAHDGLQISAPKHEVHGHGESEDVRSGLAA